MRRCHYKNMTLVWSKEETEKIGGVWEGKVVGTERWMKKINKINREKERQKNGK